MSLFVAILFWFFFYSFLGWIIDSTYRSIILRQLQNGGSIPLIPFCPIYGVGAMANLFIFPFLFPLPLPTQFILLMVLLGGVEYIGGIIALILWKRRLWDYRGHFLNIQGHTDFFHAFLWGILGLIFLYVIHPFFVELFQI